MRFYKSPSASRHRISDRMDGLKCCPQPDEDFHPIALAGDKVDWAPMDESFVRRW